VDVPIVVCGLLFQGAGGCEAVVEAGLETLDLVGIVWDVVAGSGRE
jgi:hypothetical protein